MSQGNKPLLKYTDRLKMQITAPRPMPDDMPQEMRGWWDLGEAGGLWTLEIMYQMYGEPEPHRKLLRNLTIEKLAATRVKMFSQGLAFAVNGDPGHFEIVIPQDILKVDLYQQFGYFSG